MYKGFSGSTTIGVWDLREADLRGADLKGANLSGAKYCKTQMPWGELNNDC